MHTDLPEGFTLAGSQRELWLTGTDARPTVTLAVRDGQRPDTSFLEERLTDALFSDEAIITSPVDLLAEQGRILLLHEGATWLTPKQWVDQVWVSEMGQPQPRLTLQSMENIGMLASYASFFRELAELEHDGDMVTVVYGEQRFTLARAWIAHILEQDGGADEDESMLLEAIGLAVHAAAGGFHAPARQTMQDATLWLAAVCGELESPLATLPSDLIAR